MIAGAMDNRRKADRGGANAARSMPSALASSQRMDPLSEVLALMKPQLYVAGGSLSLGLQTFRKMGRGCGAWTRLS